jgi:hypothetical protein
MHGDGEVAGYRVTTEWCCCSNARGGVGQLVDDGAATDVVKGSVSTPSMSARRCADWVVYRAGLRQHRAGSKSRTATGNQEPWRPSSSTRASATVPNRRGEGGPGGVLLNLHEEEWIRLDLHLLALDGGIPLLGHQAEVLAHSGVQRRGQGGAERPPTTGKHRRACSVLEREAGDDVAEQHVRKNAEAVEIDDVVEVRTHSVTPGFLKNKTRLIICVPRKSTHMPE